MYKMVCKKAYVKNGKRFMYIIYQNQNRKSNTIVAVV